MTGMGMCVETAASTRSPQPSPPLSVVPAVKSAEPSEEGATKRKRDGPEEGVTKRKKKKKKVVVVEQEEGGVYAPAKTATHVGVVSPEEIDRVSTEAQTFANDTKIMDATLALAQGTPGGGLPVEGGGGGGAHLASIPFPIMEALKTLSKQSAPTVWGTNDQPRPTGLAQRQYRITPWMPYVGVMRAMREPRGINENSCMFLGTQPPTCAGLKLQPVNGAPLHLVAWDIKTNKGGSGPQSLTCIACKVRWSQRQQLRDLLRQKPRLVRKDRNNVFTDGLRVTMAKEKGVDFNVAVPPGLCWIAPYKDDDPDEDAAEHYGGAVPVNIFPKYGWKLVGPRGGRRIIMTDWTYDEKTDDITNTGGRDRHSDAYFC